MQSCIILKHLALFFILCFSNICSSYAAISSTGSSVFTYGTPIASLNAFTSTTYEYNPAGIIAGPPPWDPSDNARQIQWGTPTVEDTPGSAYVMRQVYDGVSTINVPVTLGVIFPVTIVHHYNQEIFNPSIDEFQFQLSVDLNIDGDIINTVFSNLLVHHDETRNLPGPERDVADYQSPTQIEAFTSGGIDYELSILGFPVNPTMVPLNPCFEKRCYLTQEGENNYQVIEAVLNRTTPIPEPSTYLILGSLLGFVLFYGRKKLQANKDGRLSTARISDTRQDNGKRGS